MTKTQGWVLIVIVIIIIGFIGLGLYGSSPQGKVDANFQNSKAEGLPASQGAVSCVEMCNSTFPDQTTEQRCVID